jgi:tetratricopeptide (TPR) repeat protein
MTSSPSPEREQALLARRLAWADGFQFNLLFADQPEALYPTLQRLLDDADHERGHAIPRRWIAPPHAALARSREQLLDALLLPIWEHQVKALTACVWDCADAQEAEADAWIAAFTRLNELRNHVIARVPGPLLLAAPTWLHLLFVHNAGDFWSIRGVQLHIRRSPRDLLHEAVQARAALPASPQPWPTMDLLLISDPRLSLERDALAQASVARDALLAANQGRRPQMVLCAGGLTTEGEPAQMDRFDGDLHGHLRATWQLPPERIFYAPGPTDALHGLRAPDALHQAVISATDDERQRLSNDLSSLRTLERRFLPYQALLTLTRSARLQGRHPCAAWAWTSPVDGLRLGVAVLNTSLAGADQGGDLLAWQLLQAHQLLERQGAQLRVALLYHPPSGWRDPDSPEAQALPALFDLILTAAPPDAPPAQEPASFQAPALNAHSPGWLWLHLGPDPWVQHSTRPQTPISLPPLRLIAPPTPAPRDTPQERAELLERLRLSAQAGAMTPDERQELPLHLSTDAALLLPPELAPDFYGAMLQSYLHSTPQHATALLAALPQTSEARTRRAALQRGQDLRVYGDHELAQDFYAHFLPETPDDLPSAALMDELGHIALSRGDHNEAEALFHHSAALTAGALGKQHPEYAIALHNLAAVFEQQNRYQEAEALLRQSLLIYKESLGEHHPYYGTSLANLASILANQGHFRDANHLSAQALAIHQRQRRGPHHDTAQILSLRAQLLTMLGHQRAAATAREAMRMLEDTLGADHPTVQQHLLRLREIARREDTAPSTAREDSNHQKHKRPVKTSRKRAAKRSQR